MRLGRWCVERTLGRDLSGTYFTGISGDGARATLFRPSSELLAARGEPLTRLLALHRGPPAPGALWFRGLDHDGDEPFLLADPVDDALVSLHRATRPDPGQTRAVAAALAATLLALHDRDLVHGGLELDNVLWSPGHAPLLLGTGAAGLGSAVGITGPAGDVVGLGRLLCALVASWPPRGGTTTWCPDEIRTVELARLIAEPGAALSMRQAHSLLTGEPARATDLDAPSAGVALPRDPERPAGQPTTDYGADTETCTGVPRAIGRASEITRPAAPASRLGRYRILSRLGCGGMGEVFLAEDPVLRRGVAIKRIRPGLQRDATFRARLRREAQLAARLGHRAIVQVFDLLSENDVDHVVMEYVPGPSLHTLLAGRAMPVAEAVRIAAELTDGLAYAHRQGIVHRDLKLENVLISTDGQPKIADFGIARRTATTADGAVHETLTGDGLLLGTSRAMSPEQIQCHDVDARSDLFSLGVLLYELVTGTSPFAARNEAMTMLRVLHDQPLPARERGPAIPVALSDLIDHLLAKDPADRPASARTVAERLRRVPDEAPAIEPRDATRGGVNGPATPGQRGRESPLSIEPRPARTAPPAALPPPALPGVAVTAGSSEHGRSRRCLSSRIQAPFVLAEIRALRSSIFKRCREVQTALAIADKVENSYDLHRADLFLPIDDTWFAILEPFELAVVTGTLRRIGYEIFPQYVSILGIPAPEVNTAMDLRTPTDLIRVICGAYSKCVVGDDAGTLTPRIEGSRATITDTTIIPCQLQMGVFLGAGQLTGLFRDSALTEKRCRSRGDSVCVYEFAF
ncbi:MAG TPA: serine/threonine-protein kinase [Kofleriaceae bacterium]|nr:serine/threonine-protein kinase [Kofleriaceae bacterium]